jgi:hypothetical protein
MRQFSKGKMVYSARWQATKRPGAVSRSAGGSERQRSTALGQRVWKGQPDGGFAGLGGSPRNGV